MRNVLKQKVIRHPRLYARNPDQFLPDVRLISIASLSVGKLKMRGTGLTRKMLFTSFLR
jgi:hypothetical protein